MGIIETTTYECDICKRQSSHSDFNTGTECGSANLIINGHHGSISYGGDWGGANYIIKDMVCFSCADEIKQFVADLKRKQGSEKP